MQPITTAQAIDTATREVASRWRWIFAVGVLSIIFGTILLANPISTAVSLAWLIGIALVVNGVGEIAEAGRHNVRWASYLIGAIWIVTGVLAIAWPGLTLLVLARIMGIGFVLGALAQIALAMTFFSQIQHRWLTLLVAMLNLLGGVVVLAWPTVTVLVLAVLLGLRVLFQGVATSFFAWSIRGYA